MFQFGIAAIDLGSLSRGHLLLRTRKLAQVEVRPPRPAIQSRSILPAVFGEFDVGIGCKETGGFCAEVFEGFHDEQKSLVARKRRGGGIAQGVQVRKNQAAPVPRKCFRSSIAQCHEAQNAKVSSMARKGHGDRVGQLAELP